MFKVEMALDRSGFHHPDLRRETPLERQGARRTNVNEAPSDALFLHLAAHFVSAVSYRQWKIRGELRVEVVL